MWLLRLTKFCLHLPLYLCTNHAWKSRLGNGPTEIWEQQEYIVSNIYFTSPTITMVKGKENLNHHYLHVSTIIIIIIIQYSSVTISWPNDGDSYANMSMLSTKKRKGKSAPTLTYIVDGGSNMYVCIICTGWWLIF